MPFEHMERLYIPFTLKLHAFGLGRLQDPNWTGMTLFDELKQHVRGRREPYLLYEFAEQGVLFHIGLWLFDEFVNHDDRFEVQDCEDLAWYLSDLTSVLTCGGGEETEKWIRRTNRLTSFFDSIYDGIDDNLYFTRLSDSRHTLNRLHNELTDVHRSLIEELSTIYAANYADRVFHDRQLCAFIAELLVTIGFDGARPNDERRQKWIERKPPPQWAKRAVYARDRGKCALCAADMMMELDEDDHIDHIVPLANGGCNDLVNLQLLCKPCNLAKSDRLVAVSNSVPPYLSRRF